VNARKADVVDVQSLSVDGRGGSCTQVHGRHKSQKLIKIQRATWVIGAQNRYILIFQAFALFSNRYFLIATGVERPRKADFCLVLRQDCAV
jgi:hypothetical protein